MKIDPFTEDQKIRTFTMARSNILCDSNIDDACFRFAIKFLLWRFLDNEPKGLIYSTREYEKKFGCSKTQCHRFLKRLETFGYIKIEDYKDRRKLYIPTEKLIGFKTTETNVEREDLRNITSSDPGQQPGGTNPNIGRELSSDEYTL